MIDKILSYREMCNQEDVQTLQRGMNFRLGRSYSVILMSRRSNAPYRDEVAGDGITIIYEGHDLAKQKGIEPKMVDQPHKNVSGSLTQNGLFSRSVEDYKSGSSGPEVVRVYEKILDGVWSEKGFFELVDYQIVFDGKRNVFRFSLRLSSHQPTKNSPEDLDLAHTRLIPSQVKKEVWKRDRGACVLCGAKLNLHFDHDLPFSKGGTSILSANIRLLCAACNLKKSAKIE